MTTEKIATGIELTSLDEAYRADPQPRIDALRNAAPVHHDAVFNRYIVTRHDDVDAILRDRSLSVDPRKAAPGSFQALFVDPDRGEPSMLLQDPPAHTRLRGLVSKAFTPRALEQVTPRIQEVVDELLDAVEGSGGFDLIAAFAGPLPTIIIAEMLGVDPADRADFKRWSDDGVMAFDPTIGPEARAVVTKSRAELDAYLRRVIADRRNEPCADLISSMIAAEESGDRMSDDELVTMCALLLAAGNVTTTDLIGNGVLALLEHPEELRKLRDDPTLIRNAIEEMLRYDSPVTETGRLPLDDAQIAGCPVGARQTIITHLGAANHDAAAYHDPHAFDITRADTHHHSFGGGVHFCLGAPLARIEGQMAIGTLVRRFPALRRADEPLERRTIPGFRGLKRLPVLT